MTFSGLRMVLCLLHHLRFGLLFIQNKKHELKQNPSNPGNSEALPQHLAPHPQPDRKGRKGNHHRNRKQVRRKTSHSPYHRTRLEKPKSTEASPEHYETQLTAFAKLSSSQWTWIGKNQKLKPCCLRVTELWKIQTSFDSIKLLQ